MLKIGISELLSEDLMTGLVLGPMRPPKSSVHCIWLNYSLFFKAKRESKRARSKKRWTDSMMDWKRAAVGSALTHTALGLFLDSKKQSVFCFHTFLRWSISQSLSGGSAYPCEKEMLISPHTPLHTCLYLPSFSISSYTTLLLMYVSKVQNFTQDSHPHRETLLSSPNFINLCWIKSTFSTPSQLAYSHICLCITLKEWALLLLFLSHINQKSLHQVLPNTHQGTMEGNLYLPCLLKATSLKTFLKP